MRQARTPSDRATVHADLSVAVSVSVAAVAAEATHPRLRRGVPHPPLG